MGEIHSRALNVAVTKATSNKSSLRHVKRTCDGKHAQIKNSSKCFAGYSLGFPVKPSDLSLILQKVQSQPEPSPGQPYRFHGKPTDASVSVWLTDFLSCTSWPDAGSGKLGSPCELSGISKTESNVLVVITVVCRVPALLMFSKCPTICFPSAAGSS